MKEKVWKVLSYVAIALVAASAAVLCTLVVMKFTVYQELAEVKQDRDNKQLVINEFAGEGKINELKTKIYEYFIGDYDKGKMDDAAAAAIVDALGDPWSYYMSADQYGGYQDVMQNITYGIGITVEPSEDGAGYKVLVVTQNSPAYEEGVKKGDIITAVDGTSMAGVDMDTANNLIRGEEGTKTKLTILRNGEEKKFQVERKRFQLPVATYQMLENNIGLVVIENFDARCADETIAAVQALIADGAKSLIFDVRNNPGGYKDEMLRVLDYLLPEGMIFKSEDYLGNTEEDYSDASCIDLPMAVVVNGSSYSAAEFFAAALDDFGVATVVGQKTVGKGYFQNTFELSDGSAVNLSTGKYYTPAGKSLAGVGLTPEVEVSVDDWTAYYIAIGALDPEEDPQITAAVNALKSAK